MSNFTKGDGTKIAIKFTKELVGDIAENEAAFTVEGKERKHIDGELIDGNYQVEKVERYPIRKIWKLEDKLKLDSSGEMSITDSKCYEVSSGTTLTGTVEANAGDIVLATITHRSTFTMPDGWNKLYESSASIGSVNQKMIFAIRNIDQIGEVSFTAKQSSSARIYLNLIAIGGVSCIENTNYEVISTSEVASINAPNKTLGEKLIWGCSANMWVKSDYGSWKTVPDDLQMASLDSTTQARQANFIDFGEGTPTGRSFIPNAGTDTEIIVNSVRLIQEYTTPKVHTTEPIQLTGQYRIKYISDEPTNTNIKIEISTGEVQGGWKEVSNGEVITADANLWIRATLLTEDTAATPMLSRLWLEEPEQRQDIILLTMEQLKRFNNAEGNLTIKYDAAKGNLAGEGGAVESFEYAFTPTDLILKLNPYAPEKITIMPNISADFIKIYYNNRYTSERITATPNMSVELIDAELVNP